MAESSKIEWTDATWSPIRARWFEPTNDGGSKERVGWHCEHVSEGCRNCYAEAFNRRLGTGLEFKPGNLFREERVGYNNGDAKLFLDETMLLAPLRWKRPRRIFVCSMTDLFGDFVPDAMIDQVFAVMAASRSRAQHTFQILTKRPERMRRYTNDPSLPVRIARTWCRVGRNSEAGWSTSAWNAEGEASTPREWPLSGVWLGTSCEDQAMADARIPDLVATPAAVRWVSAEPLLGPIDFTRWNRSLLDWIVVGGESGPNARAMHPQWARDIRDQCASAGVAFFFKQWGEFREFDTGSPVVEGVDDDSETADAVLLSATRPSWITFAGRHVLCRADLPDDGTPCRLIERVGTKTAGRLLDGIEHNAMPEARA